MRRFRELLERLIGDRPAVLYVHSSFDRSRGFGLTPGRLLDSLLEAAGDSVTVAMPSFPRRLAIEEYLRTDPVFDVRRTPAQTGLIPELFRRRPDVRRGLHPWVSVAARGPLAEEIVGAQHQDPHPFGPRSAFRRMLGRGVTSLGLGVALDTTSFIHVVDDEIAERLPFPLYSERIYASRVVDETGRTIRVPTRVLRSAVTNQIRPSAVFERDPSLLRVESRDGAFFTGLDVVPFLEAARRFAEADLAAGGVPPWHRWVAHSVSPR